MSTRASYLINWELQPIFWGDSLDILRNLNNLISDSDITALMLTLSVVRWQKQAVGHQLKGLLVYFVFKNLILFPGV